MDFFTVQTTMFGYCFFVISHDRRRILQVNVTKHPTSAWIIQQLREAFPFEASHKYLILDRDQTRRAAPSLQSSGLVRIDVPPVLYICALYAHSGSCPPESSCCIEAIIVFRPALPRTAASWVSAEVLVNQR